MSVSRALLGAALAAALAVPAFSAPAVSAAQSSKVAEIAAATEAHARSTNGSRWDCSFPGTDQYDERYLFTRSKPSGAMDTFYELQSPQGKNRHQLHWRINLATGSTALAVNKMMGRDFGVPDPDVVRVVEKAVGLKNVSWVEATEVIEKYKQPGMEMRNLDEFVLNWLTRVETLTETSPGKYTYKWPGSKTPDGYLDVNSAGAITRYGWSRNGKVQFSCDISYPDLRQYPLPAGPTLTFAQMRSVGIIHESAPKPGLLSWNAGIFPILVWKKVDSSSLTSAAAVNAAFKGGLAGFIGPNSAKRWNASSTPTGKKAWKVTLTNAPTGIRLVYMVTIGGKGNGWLNSAELKLSS